MEQNITDMLCNLSDTDGKSIACREPYFTLNRHPFPISKVHIRLKAPLFRSFKNWALFF